MVVREKRNDKPCNHAESVNFQRQDNPSYFSASYIHANERWPRSCFHCSINFGSDYKVNNKHPVMVCENAAKHDHVCMCAMCIHCYNKMQSSEENPSDEHDDPETISLFYIFIIYYTYFQAPHHQSELLATRKKFTF